MRFDSLWIMHRYPPLDLAIARNCSNISRKRLNWFFFWAPTPSIDIFWGFCGQRRDPPCFYTDIFIFFFLIGRVHLPTFLNHPRPDVYWESMKRELRQTHIFSLHPRIFEAIRSVRSLFDLSNVAEYEIMKKNCRQFDNSLFCITVFRELENFRKKNRNFFFPFPRLFLRIKGNLRAPEKWNCTWRTKLKIENQ